MVRVPARDEMTEPAATAPELKGMRRVGVVAGRLGRFLVRVVTHLSKNHALLLAGGIAYNALLSIVPIIAILLTALTHIVDQQQLLGIIATELALLIPSQAQTITEQVAFLMNEANVIGTIGIFVLLFFSSWAFKILEGALAIIFARSKSRRKRNVWLSAVLPYIFLVVLAVGLFALTTLVAVLEALSDESIKIGSYVLSLGALPALGLKLAGFLTLVILFTAIYRVMPITEVSFRRALTGGVAAAVVWDGLRRVLMVYFGKISLVSVVYGSLATVIIVLLTLEFMALIILFGAQVISEIQHSEEAGLPWYEGVPDTQVIGVRG
jgi:membrane protein